MNRFPIWKYALIAFVIGIGFLYALPNIYVPDPAVQVKPYAAGAEVTERELEKVKSVLDGGNISYKSVTLQENSILARLVSREAQKAAQDALKIEMNNIPGAQADTYVVALNSASTTPEWLRKLGANPMNLGLDLAGGVHFVLEVDTPKAIDARMEDTLEVIKKEIRKQRIFNVQVRREGQAFILTSNSEEAQTEVGNMLRAELPQMARTRGEENGVYWVKAAVSEQEIRDIEDHAVTQNLVTLRNRVNELGVSEPLVQRQGRNRIIVELPGVQDTAGAKNIIGKTANLEFRLEAEENAPLSQKQKFEFRNEREQQITGGAYLERRPITTGEHVKNAKRSYDPETSLPQVNISLDSDGGAAMHRKTRNNIGRRLGVLFIEYLPRTTITTNEAGEKVETTIQVPSKKIISLARVIDVLGKEFRTTGLENAEAGELALLLRAGSLAAPMVFVEESTIGPSLGQENIDLGVTSVKLGLALVVLFMFIYYRAFGFAANLALTANIILLTAFMSLFGATLTLPGIAGIVLTVGMAVDANVLIFSRIKEELANGVPPQSAINSGFDRAFTTIFDANITTLIVAVILFSIGSGPVKGFAVTLSIGILTSMFTAILGTRAVVNLMYGNRKVEKLWI